MASSYHTKLISNHQLKKYEKEKRKYEKVKKSLSTSLRDKAKDEFQKT